MNTRPMTPPQSAANCWTSWATEASGGEYGITRELSAARRRELQSPGDGCRRARPPSAESSSAARRRAARPAGRRSPGRAPFPAPSCAVPRANGSRRRSRSAARDPRPVVLDAHAASVVRRRARAPTPHVPAARRRGSAALSSRLSTSRRRPPSQPRTDGVGDRRRRARSRRPGWRRRRGVDRRVDEVGELDVLAREAARPPRRGRAPAGPRAGGRSAPARRPCRATSAGALGRRSGRGCGRARRGSRAGR